MGTPAVLRQLYRCGKHYMEPSFGLCPGHFQANLVMIPSQYAGDFLKFCQENLAPCPLIFQSCIGQVEAPPLAKNSDIRTDLSTYDVYKNGHLEKTTADVKDIPWDDKVSFYLGCSFSFDDQLIASGIKLKTDSNVSMYLTNIDCIPSGVFKTKMVVSMRPINKSDLITAVQATINSNYAHGAPIHIGHSQEIGIEDIMETDFGSPPKLEKDQVPVFWACGVTSANAVKNANLPTSVTHHPGSMFVADLKTRDIPHIIKTKTYPKPSVVCIDSDKERYQILSESAQKCLNQIEEELLEDLGSRGIANLCVPEDFMKAVLTLAKESTNVGIIFGFPCFTNGTPLEENDGIAGAIYMALALLKLDKSVTLIIDSNSRELRTFLEEGLSDYLPKKNIKVVSIGKNFNEKDESFLFDNETKSPNFSHLIAIERPSPGKNGDYCTMRGRDIKGLCDPTHILFEQALSCEKIITIGIGDGGNEMGMGKVRDLVIKHVPFGDIIASRISCDYLITCGVSNWGGYGVAQGLYVLSLCPVFQRFRNHGLNILDETQKDEIVLSLEKDESLNKLIAENGYRDGITGACEPLTIDNLDYFNVHVPKLKKLSDISTKFLKLMEIYWG